MLAGLCLLAPASRANNVTVTNVSLVSVNTNAGTLQIKFDLAWENSWRVSAPPGNWDAAWVFAKYQAADGIWRQCGLNVNNTDHTVPAGATLNVGLTGTKGVGAFIYRSATGAGSVSWPNCRLLWNYGADGVRNSDMVSVDVSAIEMVYVPTGAFYAGDGASSNRFHLGSNPSAPFYVGGGGSITLSDAVGAGYLWALGLTTSLRGSTVTAPSGYTAFYCMKYECSQGQLVAFLNKTLRSFAAPWRSTRMSISGTPPLATTTTPDRAVLSTDEQTLAYLDWAALRPMTDLEYEKACRGPLPAFGSELAWGTALRALLTYALASDGTSSERVTANYDTHFGNTWDTATIYGSSPTTLPNISGTTFPTAYGPCRVGMFSLQSYSGTATARVQSGATYWGILDMSGNVGEPVCPVVGTNQVTAYTGNHGDGNLGANKLADTIGWPTSSLVMRGGGIDVTFSYWLRPYLSNYQWDPFYSALDTARPISDRSIALRAYAELQRTTVQNLGIPPPTPALSAINAFGIRGVRTAP